MTSQNYSMLRVIEETSKAVRSGPVELRRAVEVAESRNRQDQVGATAERKSSRRSSSSAT